MKRRIVLAGLLACLSSVVFGQTQLITNGGFELVEAPWTGGGSPASPQLLNNAAIAHTGSGYLEMGGFASDSQYLYQTVTFPTNAIDETFSFYYNFFSSVSGSSTLQFEARIYDTNNNFLTNIVSGSLLNSSGGQGNPYYQLSSTKLATYTGQAGLAPYAGQTVRIYFLAQTDAFGEATFLNIDDVSLLVGTADEIPSNDDFTNRIFFATNTVSATDAAINTFASKEPGEPNHGGNVGGKSVWWSWTAPSIGTLTLDTTGSSFTTLLGVYTGSSLGHLTQVASSNGNNLGGPAKVKVKVTPGTQYQIAVDGYNAGLGAQQGSIALSLTFQVDSQRPTVSITSPLAGAKLTNSTVVVRGTASDNIHVALVQYRLENAVGTNAYETAAGTNNWSAIVTNLVPGLNTVRVRAYDTSTNVSAAVARTFTYAIVSPLTLATNGNGTFSRNLNNKLLDVGVTYTVTAMPAPGWIFVDWTRDMNSDKPKLTFLMQTNMMLTAKFIPNPFIPIVGVYQGLFSDTNVAQQSSGFFSSSLTRGGLLTGKLRPGTNRYSFSAQLNPYGAWSNTLAPRGLAPLSVQLQLDLTNATLSGQISNGVWTAQLLANRAVYSQAHHAPQAGKYTLLIPGAEESEEQPGGDGFGTVTVGPAGGITFGASLPDGTKVSQSTFVSAQGQWPLYSPPSSVKGSLFGWLTFTNLATNDIDGLVSWIKLPQSSAKFYPAGFTNQTGVIASKYVFTNKVPVLSFSTGQVWLANGNLAASFTNQVLLSTNNKVSVTGTNKLSLTLLTGSGLFTGSATPPAGKPISIGGVVLEKQNFGAGFFLGTNQSGRVFFGP
jgi:hypothetical protein